MVVGLIGKGTSRSLTANWDAPLEQTNVGSEGAVSKVSGAAQAKTGTTSVTTFSTTQVWSGNNPIKFNLILDFFAWDNAAEQVMTPLQWLEEFSSPQVNGVSPFAAGNVGSSGENVLGRIPQRVSINIGRRVIVPECVIESTSAPLDGERDVKGNLLRAQATLDVQTLVMLNRSDISKVWAFSDSSWNS